MPATESLSVYHVQSYAGGSPNSWKGPQNHNENGDPGWASGKHGKRERERERERERKQKRKFGKDRQI